MIKTILIIIVFCNVLTVNAQEKEIQNFKPAFSADSKFSYGAITVGEKISNMEKFDYQSQKNRHPMVRDSNLISYSLNINNSTLNSLTSSCDSIIRKSTEYNKYYEIITEFTKDEINLKLNEFHSKFAHLQFKELIILPEKDQLPNSSFKGNYSENNYPVQIILGLNDEVIAYDIYKPYSFVPKHETIKPKLISLFGTPSIINDKQPNILGMTFGKFNNRDSKGIISLIKNLGKSIDTYKSKGVIMWVTTNRSGKFIRYNSINLGKTYDSFVAYRDQCVNERKEMYLDLIQKEKQNDTEKSKEFEL